MTDFIVTITDPDQLSGITWAKEQHNGALPPVAVVEVDPPEDGMEPSVKSSEAVIQTDQEYVQWVMEQAAISYAYQKEQVEWRQAYEAAQAQSRMRRR